MKGLLTDSAVELALGGTSATYSADSIRRFVDHFNNAKNAQKNAERIFGDIW